MSPARAHDRPLYAVDETAALATLQAAIRHASITGAEADFAGYLAELLRSLGMDEVTVGDFLPGRPNVVGIKRGSGGGRRLLLIGHTDVVHVRGWRERWAGDPREDPFRRSDRRWRRLGTRLRRPQGGYRHGRRSVAHRARWTRKSCR